MKLNEVVRGGYKEFSKLRGDKKKEQIQVINYIHRLGQSTLTDVSDWDLKKVFGSGNGNTLVVDKNEINKRFFSNRPVTKAAPDISKRLLNGLVDKKNKAKNLEITKRTKILIKEMNACNARIRRISRDIVINNKKLELMSKWSGKIKEVVSSGNWEFIKATDKELVFVNSSNVVISRVNGTAGVAQRFDFGKYKVQVNRRSLRLVVRNFKDNVSVNGHIHPFIDTDDSVCWGNAEDSINKAIGDKDLVSIMNILNTLLRTCDGGCPFEDVLDFINYGHKV